MSGTLARSRLDDANARVRAHMTQAARSLWALGQVCREVEADELYREGGYATLADWAAAEHGLARFTLAKAMAVAEHFSADMAERFGTEKLVSTVRYLQATHKVEEAGDALSLTFRVQRAGRFASVPFVDASYRDIDEARRLVLQSRQRQDATPPEALASRVQALTAALPPAPKGSGRVQRVRVESAADGRPVFTFAAIAEEDLPAFVAALQAHLLGTRP